MTATRPPIGAVRQVADQHAVLRDVFGFASFRGEQEEIVRCVAGGGDALVVMPTGSGKSLCYQIPALLRDGTAIVVSPLIALMEDQVTALRQLGIRAEFLNSSLPPDEQDWVRRQTAAGEVDLLYVAPERLLSNGFLTWLERLPVALFAIDEAHCVSQWGHDFRPEYLQLAVLHERWPTVPRIALTATADPPTRREIAAKLGLGDARLFLGGFDRPNIRYRVTPKSSARTQLVQFLRAEHPGDAGIVYCLSRKRTEETAAHLVRAGWSALPYHAGLTADLRRTTQQKFVRDEVRIIVATVAFGMGIDKPDVRFVYHLDPPKSIEAYYQETGRAGRDGLPATAMMTWGVADVAQLRQLIGSGESEARQRVEQQKLSALLGFCETARCRRQVLLQYFGETREQPCGNCDTCLQPVATWDGTDRRAESALGGAAHGRALRPGLSDRAAARPGRRAHDAARPRPAADLRGRRRPRPARLAVGVPPARGGRAARGRPRRLWRDAACRRRGQGAARRARRGAAARSGTRARRAPCEGRRGGIRRLRERG